MLTRVASALLPALTLAATLMAPAPTRACDPVCCTYKTVVCYEKVTCYETR